MREGRALEGKGGLASEVCGVESKMVGEDEVDYTEKVRREGGGEGLHMGGKRSNDKCSPPFRLE